MAPTIDDGEGFAEELVSFHAQGIRAYDEGESAPSFSVQIKSLCTGQLRILALEMSKFNATATVTATCRRKIGQHAGEETHDMRIELPGENVI